MLVPPRRRAVDALEDLGERRGAREILVRDEVRLRHGDAVDALLVEDLLRGRPEQVVPDDVARDQTLRLLGEHRAGLVRVLRLRGRLERVGEPAQAADAELEGLDEMPVRLAQVPRRVERLRAVDVLLLLLREPVELRLEILLLDARRDQDAVERRAGLRRRLRDRRAFVM